MTLIGTIKKEQGHYVRWNGATWAYIPIDEVPIHILLGFKNAH